MAARKRIIRHSDEVRAKIQATQLINRLMQNIEGKVQLSPGQVQSIKILLDKSLPNLSDVKMDMNPNGVTFNLNFNEEKK
jgi:hypothetical protein